MGISTPYASAIAPLKPPSPILNCGHCGPKNFASKVSVQESYEIGEGPIKVALIDFGVKQNILRHLVNINAEITVLPEDTQIEDIKKLKPDGIFLSNGPGDPSATEKKCRNLLQSLFKLKLPVFGICIGHQLFGLSLP